MVSMMENAPVIAIFASDKGPGDAERASLMSEVGRIFARKGARILCLAEGGIIPVPLIKAAYAANGNVEILADADIALPAALANVPVTVLPDHAERLAYMAAHASVLVGLPGSLASATSLFRTWARGAGVPVVVLNRHKAFDVLKGFASDVLAPSVSGYDRNIQFAETADELWNKVVWVWEHRP